ncbi:unnamed protein product, partial [Mesorhabditis belari]|uniref:Costars domain-containing protein n=1 Tax=Mesorhabditis belari TaxID=2138241 RepID=A0AAF3EAK5_9BILA
MEQILAKKAAQRHRGSVLNTVKMFSNIVAKTEEELKRDPGSSTYVEPKYDKNSSDYGRPPPGSKTERRGIKAGVHVCREVLFLMEKIDESAEGSPPHKYVAFGRLFYIYALYSDKLVGMLLRARKYGLVTFDGEMLYQGQDDSKLIVMMMPIEEIRERLKPSGDPKNCITLLQHENPL